MKIEVINKGIRKPVTVQTFEDEVMVHCNHDGAAYGLREGSYSYGEDIVDYEEPAVLCDKCDAWSDEDGEWYE